jgi:orotidine-5'-phosphate decarboxylase
LKLNPVKSAAKRSLRLYLSLRAAEIHFYIMKKKPCDYIALAIDNRDTIDDIRELIWQTRDSIGVFKIGMEQFTRFGPSVFEEIRSAGRKIFLDLKYHDIPNTVEKAVLAAAEHGVDILTVHTQGGPEMLAAAAKAAASSEKAVIVVGVTVLTSLDDSTLKNSLSIELSASQYARNLARIAVKAGLDGIVCSAADLRAVKPELPAGFEIITPGIRMSDGTAGDQKRIATPEDALAAGATLLVVGRPITSAEDPESAAGLFEECVSKYLNQQR